jgi:hypothetical protein
MFPFSLVLLWKCYKLTVIQPALLRYYGNLICHIIINNSPNLFVLF